MDLPAVLVRLPDGNVRRVFPVDLPEQFDEELQSWDLAFKDLETSDYVAGGVWGRKGADRFLLDQVANAWAFPETVAAIKKMTAKWPKANAKLVEDKANGPAVHGIAAGEKQSAAPIASSFPIPSGTETSRDLCSAPPPELCTSGRRSARWPR